MSVLSNFMMLTPLILLSLFRASFSPLCALYGRSFCDGSPVTITFEFIPILVRNILSCDDVAFCASSRMIAASFRVLPRMNASGAISMISCASRFLTTV